MKKQKKLLSSILLSFENKWVGLTPSGSRVFASGASVKEVCRKLDKLGNKDAVLSFVPPFDKAYSP